MRSASILKSALLLSAAVVFVPSAAHAEASSAAVESDDAGISDIVVTARRREESLQKVPIAIVAVSGEELARASIRTAQDLPTLAPGLTTTPSSIQTNSLQIGLRGQAQADFAGNADPSVGLYLDDIYAARAIGANLSLFDVAQVQVLKGPQGTLFGKNTTGGAIVISSTLPGDTFTGFVRGSYGNYSAYNLEAGVTLPVSDKLSFRVAGSRQFHKGYVKNRLGRALDDQDNFAGRITMQWKPTEGLTAILQGYYGEANENGPAGIGTFANPITGQCAPGSTIPLQPLGLVGDCANLFTGGLFGAEVAANVANPRLISNEPTDDTRAKAYGFNARITADVGDYTLKYIGGYRRVSTTNETDADGTSFGVLLATLDDAYWQVSNEIQLQGSSFGDSLKWVVGAFQLAEGGHSNSTAYAFGLFGPFAPPGSLSYANIRNESYSVFAQGTYSLSDTTRLTGGFRYTIDQRAGRNRNLNSLGGCNQITPAGTPANPCLRSLSATFRGTSWTVSLEHDLSDKVLAYATARRGFRSGGVPIRSLTENSALPFKPETVQNYEIGLKSSFDVMGTPVRFNVGAFYDDYRNIQRINLVPAGNGQFTNETTTFNAAKGKVYGGDVDLIWKPVSSLELRGNLAVAIARYDKFLYGTEDLSKARFFGAPDVSGMFSARYSLPVQSLFGMSVDEVALSGSGNYQSKVCTTAICANSFALQPSRWLFDARFEISNLGGSGVSVAAYGRNLGNKTYISSSFDQSTGSPLGFVVSQLGPPRTYGVEVTARF